MNVPVAPLSTAEIEASYAVKAAVERRKKLGVLGCYLALSGVALHRLTSNTHSVDQFERLRPNSWFILLGAWTVAFAYFLFARQSKLKKVIAAPSALAALFWTFFPRSTFLPIGVALVGNYDPDYISMRNFLPGFGFDMFKFSDSLWSVTWTAGMLLGATLVAVFGRAPPLTSAPSA